MISRIIVIGDSHLVPLKQLVESIHADGALEFHFIPVRFLQSYSRRLSKCFTANSIFFRKYLGSKSKDFYGSAGIYDTDDSSNVSELSLENSLVFLLGLGLGVDGLLRSFSQDNRLNKENCVQLAWYSSQLISSTSQFNDPYAVYPDSFVRHLLSLAIEQSYSFNVYNALKAKSSNPVNMLPLPLISLSSASYYVQGDLDPFFLENMSSLIEDWYSYLHEKSDVVNVFDLVPVEDRARNFFLNETKVYSRANHDVHMSPEAYMQVYRWMISPLR